MCITGLVALPQPKLPWHAALVWAPASGRLLGHRALAGCMRSTGSALGYCSLGRCSLYSASWHQTAAELVYLQTSIRAFLYRSTSWLCVGLKMVRGTVAWEAGCWGRSLLRSFLNMHAWSLSGCRRIASSNKGSLADCAEWAKLMYTTCSQQQLAVQMKHANGMQSAVAQRLMYHALGQSIES
jgi:hypothetical protein